VLLDIMMPQIDGLKLLEEVKSHSRWRDLPVLMISSMPPEEATSRSLGLGAADFIAKPFRVRELVARIEARLRMGRELAAVRNEARSSGELAAILHEITETLKPDEIYHVLTGRVARVLNVANCSVVLANVGDTEGLVVAAHENPMLRNLRITLAHYPEIEKALEIDSVVLVSNVQTDPLYAMARDRWSDEGIVITTGSCIAVPFETLGGQRGAFFVRRSADEPPLTEAEAEFADRVVGAAMGAIEKAHSLETAVAARDHLEKLASTDPLTGCLNRRALARVINSELERARRYESDVSILLADLDRFKQVNDTRGHVVGDSVLAQVGEMLRYEARTADVVARYGGEEFVVVMPQTALGGATMFAERIRERVEEHDFAREKESPLHITVSIGVATYPDDRIVSADTFISVADGALYRAKHGGRNLVRDLRPK
jgi:two-component system cell cycle response regulator